MGYYKTLYCLRTRFFGDQCGRLLINSYTDVPIVTPTTCGTTKLVNYIILDVKGPILDHAHRSMVPRTRSYQQDRSQILNNKSHVWPHTVCCI